MGTLLELGSAEKNVHMLLTSSNLIELYVYDKIRDFCKASRDESIYEANTVREFRDIIDLVNLYPMQSNKWLFIIDYSKIKREVEKNKGIFESVSSCFLIRVSKYKDFKDFKEFYPKVNDLYLSVIRRNEVMYLLDGYGLSQKLVDFVAKSYYRDPEKVFTLKKALDSGSRVSTQKDIVSICGSSAGSINHFIMLLLAPKPTTEKGSKTVYHNRISIGLELIDTYGISSVYNFLVSGVKDLIQIKTLYLRGVIYDSIRDLPPGFDEKKLSRYSIYLRKIKEEISYSSLMSLYLALKENGKWFSYLDMIKFLYDYYGGVDVNADTSKLQSE